MLQTRDAPDVGGEAADDFGCEREHEVEQAAVVGGEADWCRSGGGGRPWLQT